MMPSVGWTAKVDFETLDGLRGGYSKLVKSRNCSQALLLAFHLQPRASLPQVPVACL